MTQRKVAEGAAKRRAGGYSIGAKKGADADAAAERMAAMEVEKRRLQRKTNLAAYEAGVDLHASVAAAVVAKPHAPKGVVKPGSRKGSEDDDTGGLDMVALAAEAEAYRAIRRAEAQETVEGSELPKRKSSMVYLASVGQSVDESILGQKVMLRPVEPRPRTPPSGRGKSKDKQAEWVVPENATAGKAQRLISMGKDVPSAVLKATTVVEKQGVLLVPVDTAAVSGAGGAGGKGLTDEEEIVRATQFTGTLREVDNPGSWDADLKAVAGAAAAVAVSNAGGRRTSMAGGIVGQVKVAMSRGPADASAQKEGEGEPLPDAYVIRNRRMSMDEYMAQGVSRGAVPQALDSEATKQLLQAQEANTARSQKSRVEADSTEEKVASAITAVQMAYAKENARLHGGRRASLMASQALQEGSQTYKEPTPGQAGKDSTASSSSVVHSTPSRRKSGLTIEDRVARMKESERKRLNPGAEEEEEAMQSARQARRASLPGAVGRL
jgi:hypothetical protein